MDIRLSAIHLYPVKGIRGVAPGTAVVESRGLQGDRRWIVVDEAGRFLSQRTCPRLALVTGQCDLRGCELSAPGRPPLRLEIPAGTDRIKVTVWSDQVEAAAADPGADRWLSRFLDQACRLAYMDEASRRPISSSGGRPGETVSFADGYPCLLVSTASLEDLNCRLAHPVPMDRFRPNLVVAGCEPFAEDGWRRISIGETVFRFAGLCARCTVTTVDQETGVITSGEPLRTLARYRQKDQGAVFGVNLVPETTGLLAVGDRMTILE